MQQSPILNTVYQINLSLVARVTRQVALVELELFTLPEAHELNPDSKWGSCWSNYRGKQQKYVSRY